MRFGLRLQAEIFGSSHGPEVGVVLSGVPEGTRIDLEEIQAQLDRRRPVGRRLATKRQEEDRLIVDSGVTQGAADGKPIRFHVANEDVQRSPYEQLRSTPRPGHADFPARIRYGTAADLSGGGIFSGRMTVGLVMAGAVARQMLRQRGVETVAFTRSIGEVEGSVPESMTSAAIAVAAAANEVGCPDASAAAAMEKLVQRTRRAGDSVGGIIECRTFGIPVGLGEPFFDSIESTLAHLCFAIPAVKGVEFGAGFGATRMLGSAHNDPFGWSEGRVVTLTNHAGGILGGLATGMPIVFRVAVKPTSSIALPQQTVDLETRREVRITVTGRHDPCIVPRAGVVVESIASLGLADLAMQAGFLP